MLRHHYPMRGAHWAGWADVLPGRSVGSIKNRVTKLGLHVERPEPAIVASADDKVARGVLMWLNEGLTPSQIDATMGLPSGTARATASEAWRKDRDG